MQHDTLSQSRKLAVLIDADNSSADLLEALLTEIAKYGTAHVKRIYGDWTSTRLTKWKDKLNRFAVQPIQQFGYTTGKNATDSAMIIDAMDLLYAQNCDGFCLISSDSDFTRLASRIRESGLVVYGFGEQKTPEAFVSACDKFVYTEILREPEKAVEKENGTISAYGKKTVGAKAGTAADPKLVNNSKLIKLLRDSYEAIAEEDEWIHLGLLGTQITKISSSFDPRNYGYKKLSELVQASQVFEIKKEAKSILIKYR
ncbi:MAG: NYN domain-containing protein [Kaiparowitsia implicata GSE-PSE-MK54-09C]|jgi:uncharacterized LabA/DUF88 family protein|nr:NYN domain-containing protein [Kaiparowitsia implicata GSE-PSE-MK54-09C]